ncbi:HPP family protein [Paraburkholderia sp. BCC1884]|uniref:HPP family protein n=1 Tax=Paraburkholderia sp. BCC1884 TaxID=2562668 RepID=UPI0011826605|nr:HPP family protein [Paraburkholderia sp. BCC1884]
MHRSTLTRWLARFAPPPIALAWKERLRSCIGALIGIGFTGSITYLLLGSSGNIPLLVAPMGASAVLLFAVPSSPLAQPWSIMGGNLVSAAVGVACAHWIGNPLLAAPLAVAAAICAMFMLRCVHPPSGAVALTAVLGGPAVHALGYRFVAAPIALQSAALLGSAIVYHALTGHRYPHSAKQSTGIADAAGQARPGFTRADLDAVLKRQGELLDIAPDDLESLLRALQLQTYARSFDELTCASIMSREVIVVSAQTRAATAWSILQRHGVKALPVTDEQQHVIGIVTRADLAGAQRPSTLTRLRHTLFGRKRASESTVGTLMTTQVRTVETATPIADLVPLFADFGHHHIPVLDSRTQQLAGIVTQANLIAGLHRQPRKQEPMQHRAA